MSGRPEHAPHVETRIIHQLLALARELYPHQNAGSRVTEVRVGRAVWGQRVVREYAAEIADSDQQVASGSISRGFVVNGGPRVWRDLGRSADSIVLRDEMGRTLLTVERLFG